MKKLIASLTIAGIVVVAPVAAHADTPADPSSSSTEATTTSTSTPPPTAATDPTPSSPPPTSPPPTSPPTVATVPIVPINLVVVTPTTIKKVECPGGVDMWVPAGQESRCPAPIVVEATTTTTPCAPGQHWNAPIGGAGWCDDGHGGATVPTTAPAPKPATPAVQPAVQPEAQTVPAAAPQAAPAPVRYSPPRAAGRPIIDGLAPARTLIAWLVAWLHTFLG
jgi:hypothetical protein